MARVKEQSTVRQARGAARKPSPPPPSSPVPKRLGKYDLLFEIGRGGMGSVHVARSLGDHGFDRVLAVKCLPQEGASPEALASLAAEAKITAKINHPNVVDTFEFGIDAGWPYLAMRFVEGVPLSRLLDKLADKKELLDPSIAAWIVAQASQGLHAAHELTNAKGDALGLVHRDISPQNLLVSADGRVYVADFGVAKLFESERVTANGVIKGKFGYMSPEQTRADQVDRRSDVFSLGVVLVEMLTGKAPFSAKSPAEAVYKIMHAEVANPHDARSDVPEELGAIAQKCLAKERDQRFDSAKALGEALRAFLKEQRKLVDETDLAAVVERLSGEEIAALRTRIRESAGEVRASAPPAARDPSTPPAESRPPTETATVTGIGGVPSKKRRAGTWAIMAGIAAVIGAVIWVKSMNLPPPPLTSSASSTTQQPAAPPPPLAPLAPPTETATSAPTNAIPSVEASSSATPPASAAPSDTSKAQRRTAPPPTVPPDATATPATSSHRGEPFRVLGN